MKSEYLRTLIETIATGSFSKAAENLLITQSAVSRRIKFLEDQYGYSLIDRSGPVLLATDVGKMVIEKAEKMLRIEDDLLSDLRTLSPKSGINFCCTPSFGITYLPLIMNGFMILKPDMLELKFAFEMPDKVVEGMNKGLYQVGVIEHNEDYDLAEFEAFELPGDEVVFVSSPKLGIMKKKLPIEQLTCFDLYIRKEGCCSSKLLEYNFKKSGKTQVEFNRIIHYDDLHLIIKSVLDGHGIAFVSQSVVSKFVDEGALLTHQANGFEHAFKRTLIVNRTSAATPLINGFIEEIRGVFKRPTAQRDVLSCNVPDYCLPPAP